MNRFLSCLALTFAFSLATIVRADTFLNLQLDGYAHDDLKLNLPVRHITGLFSLDTTTGRFVSGSLDYLTEPYVFSADQSLQSSFLENDFSFSNTVNEFGYSTEPGGAEFDIILVLNLPVASLVGYKGGYICSESNFADCGGAGSVFGPNSQQVLEFSTGSLTPTPEPSSLVLLCTGVLGVTFTILRKTVRI